MILKTLKQKQSTSLTLDDEFLQYCKLNNIEDIEKLARETFNQGFAILKYGRVPSGVKIEDIPSPPIKKVETIPIVKPVITSEKKVEKNNIYGE
jgi:hypothetical protein